MIHGGIFEPESTEWSNEKCQLQAATEKHRNANQDYFANGIQLPELAVRAASPFDDQPPAE